MLELPLSTTVLLAEAQRGREDGPPALTSLHRAGRKALAVTHALDVVQDGDLRVARQHEVAVHAVHGEVGGDGALGGGEALGDGGTAVDTARAWGVPEGASVGEDILLQGLICQR